MTNTVIFGAVAGALGVVVVAIIVFIVMATAVIKATKRRKPQYQNAAGKGMYTSRDSSYDDSNNKV